jgi:hypothetical protein
VTGVLNQTDVTPDGVPLVGRTDRGVRVGDEGLMGVAFWDVRDDDDEILLDMTQNAK